MADKPLSLVAIQWLIRDARSTKGAQRELLIAIALRFKPDNSFKCWPSYAQLAEDTQLDPATLKRAAKALEDRKLIQRKVRKNTSNVFFMNIELLQQQVAEAKLKMQNEDVDEFPFGPPTVDAEVDEDAEFDYDESDESMDAVFGGGR